MEETRIGWETALAIVAVLVIYGGFVFLLMSYMVESYYKSFNELSTPELLRVYKEVQDAWLRGKMSLATLVGVDGSIYPDPSFVELCIIDEILAARGEDRG